MPHREITNPDGSKTLVGIDDFGTPTDVTVEAAPPAPENFSPPMQPSVAGPSVEAIRQSQIDEEHQGTQEGLQHLGPTVDTGVVSSVTGGPVVDDGTNLHLKHADSPTVEELQANNPQDRAGDTEEVVEGPTQPAPEPDSEAVNEPAEPSHNENALVAEPEMPEPVMTDVPLDADPPADPPVDPPADPVSDDG